MNEATVLVRNEGGGDLVVVGVNAIMDDGDGWLSAALVKEDTPAFLSVVSDSEGLADGTYHGRVEIETNAGTETVQVVLEVQAPPDLAPGRRVGQPGIGAESVQPT